MCTPCNGLGEQYLCKVMYNIIALVYNLCYRRIGKLCGVNVMRFVLSKHYAILIYAFLEAIDNDLT